MTLTLDQLLHALKGAGEETRLRILALFKSGELTVTEIVSVLRQSQPRISRHLRLLCEAGLLERHREGTWIFYRLSEGKEQSKLVKSILDFMPYDDQILQHDQERLSEVKRERDRKAAEYFNDNAANWDQIRSLYVPEQQVEEYLLKVTKDMQIEEMLDVGTGTGRMLELFSQNATSGVGIDLSREMLAIARSHLEQKSINHMQVRQGDMYDLALPDQAMDLVIFHQVLHFADDPLAAIKETARILRPNGRVVIVDFLPHKIEKLREEYAHRRLGFSKSEVQDWCSLTGLNLKSTEIMKGSELDIAIWVATKK
ncbi:ArsR/SmtB family transcription factor [Pseudemcibacter aquimaris]|uniref:ArsR/SmtB family transcription factor n=1 Tax=Pseudemcibacter aquimaris TaxID=2857064 RepID=UPI002012BB7E|nr:metalloregulator ArsR/SmtB family transcription factor [Pseudemcibacter aquimaris]MCC3862153.1 metalloregulator ArsR/SmtB family transcription factor [Pseudemcibacter aquimaris]WDU58906.1 metalloregulator ArsR/SmtB family transcription factor [Pseudemcibacter aquimaris]